jgi:hypothetical protein
MKCHIYIVQHRMWRSVFHYVSQANHHVTGQNQSNWVKGRKQSGLKVSGIEQSSSRYSDTRYKLNTKDSGQWTGKLVNLIMLLTEIIRIKNTRILSPVPSRTDVNDPKNVLFLNCVSILVKVNSTQKSRHFGELVKSPVHDAVVLCCFLAWRQRSDAESLWTLASAYRDATSGVVTCSLRIQFLVCRLFNSELTLKEPNVTKAIINNTWIPQSILLLPWVKFPFIRRCIQKFPDRIDNEIYSYNDKHSLRHNTKAYGGKTHYTDSPNSDTTAPSGTICSSRFCRPIRKLLDAPSYVHLQKVKVNVNLSLCLTEHYNMKMYWWWRYSSTHFWPRQYKEVSGQLHAPAALPPGNKPSVSVG